MLLLLSGLIILNHRGRLKRQNYNIFLLKKYFSAPINMRSDKYYTY